MPRLKLYFTYDGTFYSGLQRQSNTPNTIQEVIESKLSMMGGQRVTILASGRTDAGVHARIQVAHTDVPDSIARLMNGDDSRLKKSLNSMLPPDIRILLIERAKDSFHAIGCVRKKTYVYFIDPNPIQVPELRNHAWHLRLPLDWPAMQKATEALVGRHDFKAFCGAGSNAKTTTRRIHSAYWGSVPWRGLGHSYDLMAFRVTGSGFLKHMVRIIVGTLTQIGNGRVSPDIIEEAFKEKDRTKLAATAPAHGLWLWDVQYKRNT